MAPLGQRLRHASARRVFARVVLALAAHKHLVLQTAGKLDDARLRLVSREEGEAELAATARVGRGEAQRCEQELRRLYMRRHARARPVCGGGVFWGGCSFLGGEVYSKLGQIRPN